MRFARSMAVLSGLASQSAHHHETLYALEVYLDQGVDDDLQLIKPATIPGIGNSVANMRMSTTW